MSNLDHIVLFCLLFAIFFTLSRVNQQILNKHYWKIVAIPIILYSLILGCRYGWGNDYLWYKRRMENPYYYSEEDFGFQSLNLLIKEIGLNYVGGYIIYSLLYIIGAFVLIKDFKQNKYMLTFFLPATLLQSTYTIRQSVAHSFIFLALHYFFKKNWGVMISMVLIAYSIHPAALLLIIPIIICFFLKNKVIPWQISIPIYTATALLTDFFSSHISTMFMQYLPMLSLDNKFNSYIQNEYWFNENAIQEEWKQGTLTLLLSMAFHISIFYTGYLALKYRPNFKVAYFYNTVIIGFILQRLFWTFEIFRRIATPYTILYFIPLGYVFFFWKNNRNRLSILEKKQFAIGIALILIYLILYYGRFIWQSPQYDFFWNKII